MCACYSHPLSYPATLLDVYVLLFSLPHPSSLLCLLSRRLLCSSSTLFLHPLGVYIPQPPARLAPPLTSSSSSFSSSSYSSQHRLPQQGRNNALRYLKTGPSETTSLARFKRSERLFTRFHSIAHVLGSLRAYLSYGYICVIDVCTLYRFARTHRRSYDFVRNREPFSFHCGK